MHMQSDVTWSQKYYKVATSFISILACFTASQLNSKEIRKSKQIELLGTFFITAINNIGFLFVARLVGYSAITWIKTCKIYRKEAAEKIDCNHLKAKHTAVTHVGKSKHNWQTYNLSNLDDDEQGYEFNHLPALMMLHVTILWKHYRRAMTNKTAMIQDRNSSSQSQWWMGLNCWPWWKHNS